MRYVWRSAGFVLLVLFVTGCLFYRYPLWFLDRPVYYNLWRAQAKGQSVEVGSYMIHYYEAGPATGPPLVLVHGLGSRGEDWANLIPAFVQAGFHVYAPDLLGYGRSSRPDVNYSIGLEEGIVVQFLQAVHLPKASVIGWSMGGWVAMQLALDHPALVDRLVVYDSAGTYFPAVLPNGLFAPDDVSGVQRLIDVLEPEPRAVPAFIAKDQLRKLQANAWVVNRSLASMLSGRYLLDFRLGGLRQPLLILWGGADHLIPASVGEGIHQLVPQSVYEEVEGCGHLAPAECAKPFLEGTIEFLKAQPPMPRGEKIYPKPRITGLPH